MYQITKKYSLKSNKIFSYFRCCRYKKNCGGRSVLENGRFREIKGHNHPPDADRVLVDRFRKILTQRSASEKTDLYTIYYEEAQKHADAALLYSFTQAESCMRKARRKKPPQAPNTLRELGTIIGQSDLFSIHNGNHKDKFYQTTINQDDASCIIFFHERTLEVVKNIDEMHLDCSIYSAPQTPPNFYLLSGHSIQQHNSIPIFYVIMSAKTHSCYVAAFNYLKERLGSSLRPKNILTEFDSMLQNALTTAFPESTVKGCWFHYTDAIIDRLKALGMTREIAKGHGSSGLRMLLVLPLLPANYMAPGMDALKKWLSEKNVYSKNFENLCEFVETQWINGIGAEKISIFRLPHSIYNHVKMFNKQLMEIVGIQMPMIWHMLGELNKKK